MKLDIIWTSQFKKDYKKAIKRGNDMNIIDDVIRMLSRNEVLPEKYKDHELKGNYKGYRECHLYPDWLLIYKIDNGVLTLVLSRTGSHSDLF
ncbi:MAG: addiction module toxin RelE [Epulopiscium sp. Nele67-Bin004]|nr:MAG: addiction module toxin RelE [Epulopiscium sp. Nele67-Bin004]